MNKLFKTKSNLFNKFNPSTTKWVTLVRIIRLIKITFKYGGIFKIIIPKRFWTFYLIKSLRKLIGKVNAFNRLYSFNKWLMFLQIHWLGRNLFSKCIKLVYLKFLRQLRLHKHQLYVYALIINRLIEVSCCWAKRRTCLIIKFL